MATDPDLRAGDEDRDRTITTLREAYAEGRLDADEFQARMTSAQQSRTFGELAALVKDLPGTHPAPATRASSARVPDDAGHEDDGLRKGWAAWAGVSVLVNVIWLGTWMTEGSPTYYWPIWVMGPWGAAMLIGTLSRRAR